MAPKIANRRLIAACSITELIKLPFTTARVRRNFMSN